MRSIREELSLVLSQGGLIEYLKNCQCLRDVSLNLNNKDFKEVLRSIPPSVEKVKLRMVGVAVLQEEQVFGLIQRLGGGRLRVLGLEVYADEESRFNEGRVPSLAFLNKFWSSFERLERVSLKFKTAEARLCESSSGLRRVRGLALVLFRLFHALTLRRREFLRKLKVRNLPLEGSVDRDGQGAQEIEQRAVI